jgi:hypothetical protein
VGLDSAVIIKKKGHQEAGPNTFSDLEVWLTATSK